MHCHVMWTQQNGAEDGVCKQLYQPEEHLLVVEDQEQVNGDSGVKHPRSGDA